MSQSMRPLPPILNRKGFNVYNDWFGVGDQSRVEGARLRELLNPQDLPKRDQRSAIEEARLRSTSPSSSRSCGTMASSFRPTTGATR